MTRQFRNALQTFGAVVSPLLGKRLAIAALSLAVTAFGSDHAQAGPPQPAEGIFLVNGATVNSVEPAGNVCLIELQSTFLLEDTFEGSLTADFLIIHFGPCDQLAPEVFVATGTYTGQVNEASGSFDFSFVGDIDAEGNAEGDLVIHKGTDELEGLSGQITLSGITGVGGEYAGSIHFAP